MFGKLGLAREGVDRDYPEDGPITIYGSVKKKRK